MSLSRLKGAGSPEFVLRAAIASVFGALLAAGIAYALLGVDLLDHLRLFPGCPFRAVTGIPCPGCGMTRAFLLLSQLRFGEALAAQPAAPLLAAAMAGRLVAAGGATSRRAGAVSGLLLAAVLGAWVVRVWL